MAQPVEIYTSGLCPYCHRALKLLKRKGAAVKKIDVTGRPWLRSKMKERAGGRHTVPQIFIAGEHVGGCDDLYALESHGRLDAMLGAH